MGLPTSNHGSTIDVVVERPVESSIGAKPDSEDEDVLEDDIDSQEAIRLMGGKVGEGRVEHKFGDAVAQLLLQLSFSRVLTVL